MTALLENQTRTNDDRTGGKRGRSSLVKGRHKWSPEPLRLQFKTERHCIICGLVKVTRHEPGEYSWTEFYRGLEKVEASGTPGCGGVSLDELTYATANCGSYGEFCISAQDITARAFEEKDR